MDLKERKISVGAAAGSTEAEENDTPITQEELLMSEDEILQAMIEAAEEKEHTYKRAQIVRDKVVKLTFRVRGLSEDEVHACRKKAVTKRGKKYGVNVAEEVDGVLFRNLVIYTATHEEDRKKLWDNKAFWKKYNLVTGTDAIDKILFGGEKEAVMDLIDSLSGYDLEVDDIIKN